MQKSFWDRATDGATRFKVRAMPKKFEAQLLESCFCNLPQTEILLYRNAYHLKPLLTLHIKKTILAIGPILSSHQVTFTHILR